MNIQLRDSKPLQDALKTRAHRNTLPRAQLHPELLNGIVDCDRNGFNIRSELLTGDNRGVPNEQDVQNLKDFLPAPSPCEAVWKNVSLKQGDSSVNIPSELSFTFPDNSKLVIHTQSVSDVTKLTSALPSDRSAKFYATPGEGRITFVLAGTERPISSPTMTPEQLETMAGVLGVEWDKNASIETMNQRVMDALAEKDKPKQQKKPKLETATV